MTGNCHVRFWRRVAEVTLRLSLIQKLELVITTVGTGLAVSGISSQVATHPTEKILPVSKQAKDANLASYLVCSSLDIVFHLLVGVILATPVGIIAWWWRRKPK